MILAFALILAGTGVQADYFTQRVEPILRKHCLGCHNHELDDGGISFEDRSTLLRDRPNKGPAVVPGDPEKSSLVRAIRHRGDVQMPPGKKLRRQEIKTLIRWIELGAPYGHAARDRDLR